MGYWCRLVRYFINSFVASRSRWGGRPGLWFRPSGLLFFFLARFTSFQTHASLLTSFCFFVLFHSCCSHAGVFPKTLVHEFPISYSHTEWYLLLSDSATTRPQTRIRCEMEDTSQSTSNPV